MKPLSSLLLFLTLGTLLLCNPATAQSLRALWGFEAVGAFGGTPEETVAAVQELGANAVFSNKLAPELLRALHAARIKVFTTVNVFGDQSLWKRYPQLRPMNSNGERLEPQAGNGICPAQRGFWPRMHRTIGQRIEAGYDGVWLDFIRFSGHWEQAQPQLERTCFCDSSLADFARSTGLTFPNDLAGALRDNSVDSTKTRSHENAAKAAWILANHRTAWRNYNTDLIAEFTRQSKEIVVKKNATALLGLFLVPWERSEYGFAMLDVFGQDYRKLREHADVFSPMLYHQLCGREVEWIARFVEYTAQETGKPVWPIIQCDLGPEHRVSDDTFAAAVLNASDPPAQGMIIFNHKALVAAKQTRILGSLWRLK